MAQLATRVTRPAVVGPGGVQRPVTRLRVDPPAPGGRAGGEGRRGGARRGPVLAWQQGRGPVTVVGQHRGPGALVADRVPTEGRIGAAARLVSSQLTDRDGLAGVGTLPRGREHLVTDGLQPTLVVDVLPRLHDGRPDAEGLNDLCDVGLITALTLRLPDGAQLDDRRRA